MDQNSPYRVQVMRIANLKPEDVARAAPGTPPADTPAPVKPARTADDVPVSLGSPVGAPQASVPTNNRDDVRPTSSQAPTTAPSVAPTSVTAVLHAATEPDAFRVPQTEHAPFAPGQNAHSNEAVSMHEVTPAGLRARMQSLTDANLPRMNTSLPQGETSPTSPNTLQRMMPPTEVVSAVPGGAPLQAETSGPGGAGARPEVLTAGWVPITEDPGLRAPEPVSPESAPAAVPNAAPNSSNLSALRDRVLHGESSTEFHEKTRAALASPDVQSLAQARKAKLAGANIQTLQDLHQVEALTDRHEEIASNMLAEMGTRPEGSTPTTTHAAAIADVAKELHALQQEAPSTPPSGGNPNALPTMRTFRGDVEHTVMHNKTSVVSAIAAEQNRVAATTVPDLVGHKQSMLTPGSYLLLGMSIVLLLGGLFGVGAYLFLSKTKVVVPQASLPAFIFLEKQEQIDVTGKGRGEIMDHLEFHKNNANVRLGAITGVHLIEQVNQGGVNKTALLSAPLFLERINARAPDALVRNLRPEMLIGIHEFRGNQPFLIFKTMDYQLTYAAMLEWERSINLDLYPLFGPIITKQQPILPDDLRVSPIVATSTNATSTSATSTGMSTSTASTTATTSEVFIPSVGARVAGFQDAIYTNIEARVLRTSTGDAALIWALPDPQTLIITTNEYTFKELRDRMTARTF